LLQGFRSFAVTAVWVVLGLMLVASLSGGLALPSQAPPLQATDLQGKQVDLAQLRGQPVVLYFWASWCTACKLTSPTVASFARRHPEVRVLGVAMEDADAARAYLGQALPPYAVLVENPAIRQAYPVRALPTTVVIDRGGKVAWSRQGVLLPGELDLRLP